MDCLDLRILRELTRDRVILWGCLDPNLSAGDIAERLGVDRSTVRARIRQWEEGGFLRGQVVLPNPALFGAGIAGGSLRVDDVRSKTRVLEDLALVDGVVSALDHVGPWIALTYIHENDRALERRRKLVERLPGVTEVEPCHPFRAPGCSVKPSAVGWKVLKVLREAPSRPLHEAAEAAGVSNRTFRRHYQELVAGQAVWSVPLLDFSRYTGAVAARMLIPLTDKANEETVIRQIQAEFPDCLELTPLHEVADGIPGRVLDLFLHLAAVGAVEEVRKVILGISGVADVEAVYPRRLYTYGDWFDEQVAQSVARSRARAPIGGPVNSDVPKSR